MIEFKLLRLSFLVLLLASCQQQLQLKIPKESTPELLEISNLKQQHLSLSIIGEFTGRAQVRVLFYDSLNTKFKDKNDAMVLLDEFTNGGYFTMPEHTRSFRVELWRTVKYYHNTIYLKKIIIRDSKEIKVISKDSFTAYFELTNITYDPKTGALNPVNKTPIPHFVYKGKNLNF